MKPTELADFRIKQAAQKTAIRIMDRVKDYSNIEEIPNVHATVHADISKTSFGGLASGPRFLKELEAALSMEARSLPDNMSLSVHVPSFGQVSAPGKEIVIYSTYVKPCETMPDKRTFTFKGQDSGRFRKFDNNQEKDPSAPKPGRINTPRSTNKSQDDLVSEIIKQADVHPLNVLDDPELYAHVYGVREKAEAKLKKANRRFILNFPLMLISTAFFAVPLLVPLGYVMSGVILIKTVFDLVDRRGAISDIRVVNDRFEGGNPMRLTLQHILQAMSPGDKLIRDRTTYIKHENGGVSLHHRSLV